MSSIFNVSSSFNSVTLIQSLGLEDRAIAQSAVEGILIPLANEHSRDFSVQQFNVGTLPELKASLSEVHRRIVNDGLMPLLHFDCHGSEEGIHLSSGECVSWDSLCLLLKPLNRAVRMKLVVVLSCCYGGYIHIGMDLNESPAPYWMIIGTRTQMFESDSIRGIWYFYDSLLRTRSGGGAISSLNYQLESSGEMLAESAILLFSNALRGYMREASDPVNYSGRVARMRRLIESRYFAYPQIRQRRLDEDFSARLLDFETVYWRYLFGFFCIKEFPELLPEVTRTYDEILSGHALGRARISLGASVPSWH